MLKIITVIAVTLMLNSCIVVNSEFSFITPDNRVSCSVSEELLVLPTLEYIPDDKKNDPDYIEERLIYMIGVHRKQLKLLIQEVTACK